MVRAKRGRDARDVGGQRCDLQGHLVESSLELAGARWTHAIGNHENLSKRAGGDELFIPLCALGQVDRAAVISVSLIEQRDDHARVED